MSQAIIKGFAVALLAFVIGNGATAAYRKLHPQYRYTGLQSQIAGNGSIVKTRNYDTPSGNIIAIRLTVQSESQARELMVNSLQKARLAEREILRDDSGKQIGERAVMVHQTTAAQKPFIKVTLQKGSSMLFVMSNNSDELFVVEKMAVSDFDF